MPDDALGPVAQPEAFTVWRHGGRGRDRWRIVATIPAARVTVKVGGVWGPPHKVARSLYDRWGAKMRQGGVALLAPAGQYPERLASDWSPRLRTRW